MKNPHIAQHPTQETRPHATLPKSKMPSEGQTRLYSNVPKSNAWQAAIERQRKKNTHFLGRTPHILKKEVLFLQIVSIVLIERHCGENHRHRQHP